MLRYLHHAVDAVFLLVDRQSNGERFFVCGKKDEICSKLGNFFSSSSRECFMLAARLASFSSRVRRLLKHFSHRSSSITQTT